MTPDTPDDSRQVGPVKRVALVAAALFLSWQSVGIFRALTEVAPRAWVWIVVLSWIFSMMVTGVFAFAGFALPTHRLLPPAYYRVTQPERLGAVYRALRVGTFRRVLLATIWRARTMRRRYFDGSAADLDHLVTQSHKAEFGHVIPFVLLTAASVVWMTSRETLGLGLMTLAWNVGGNLYPVLLQRHHRMRVQRLRARQQARGRSRLA